ncbi:MAG: LysM peptidoglycan-binding domain-containing protein [bacterium]|nr:LysM peptidoglycan-binding domain-containing protein [bacterium]
MFQYTIKNGDTFENIASKFGINVEEIKKYNNIQKLTPNSILYIPYNNSYDYYVVKRGDTLYNIANENNTDVSILSQINGIKTYDYLHPGQILLIPKQNTRIYITKPGDTVQSVLRKNRYTLENLINNNKNIYLLEDQVLVFKD